VAYALISHRADNLGANGGTSGTFNSTGADLIVVAVSYNNTGAGLTLTDSASNTWTSIAIYTAAPYEELQAWYCHGPTTSASHTVSFGGASSACSVNVSSWSGSAASSLDQHSGAAGTGLTTQSAGSITPTSDNALVLAFCTVADANTATTTTSGFTPSGSDSTWQTAGVSFQNNGISQDYQIQTTATAVNPSWSSGAATAMTAMSTSFLTAGVTFAPEDDPRPIGIQWPDLSITGIWT
jgi:hypothetical protein